MKLQSVSIIVLAIVCFAFSFASEGSETIPNPQENTSANKPCKKWEPLHARSFWYYEVYFGVDNLQEKQGLRTGRVQSRDPICFSVALKDLEDTMTRVHGYKDALQEILRYRIISIQIGDDDPKARLARAQKAVGRKFENQQAMRKWWHENKDYLLWSTGKGHLIIDEKAKELNKPVSKEYQTITAHLYWHSLLMGRIQNEFREGKFLKGDIWTYHGYRGVTLPLNELDDIIEKEMGYLNAVGEVVSQYMSSSSLSNKSHEYYVERLQGWTGLPYARPEKWTRWWKKYHDRLKYSAKENRLLSAN